MLAKNPSYCDENGGISLLVKPDEAASDWMIFIARPTDREVRGRELHQRATAGEFGAIKPFNPPHLPPDPSLEEVRAEAMHAIVIHIDTITESALTTYPKAEVESWPIQKAEAEMVLSAGSNATLEMAPFLVGVCSAQFGTASDTDRLAQLIEKAQAVKANADAWASMAAYVNGLRARTQLAIQAASDVAGVDAALAAGRAEGEAFREANGP